jgi:hypothetical protein
MVVAGYLAGTSARVSRLRSRFDRPSKVKAVR